MSTVAKKKWQVTANSSQCTMCSMCQLVCSLAKKKIFNPSEARINIAGAVKPDGSLDVSVTFTEDCDGCGICAKYCLYGALARVKVEA